ncbi:MAG TPA: cytidine deaminase [Aggregatilineales bacterium]|nr:cytidine deaminase [Aggregatilineales bacterium]
MASTASVNSASQTLSDVDKQRLIAAAQHARQYAYAPYSDYLVGAALLAPTGEIYSGCNVENAAYPSTICAERVALVKAVSEGIRNFNAIAVVTANGGFPCGSCRQMLYEFCPQATVIIADEGGQIIDETTLSALLPGGFGRQQVLKHGPA